MQCSSHLKSHYKSCQRIQMKFQSSKLCFPKKDHFKVQYESTVRRNFDLDSLIKFRNVRTIFFKSGYSINQYLYREECLEAFLLRFIKNNHKVIFVFWPVLASSHYAFFTRLARFKSNSICGKISQSSKLAESMKTNENNWSAKKNWSNKKKIKIVC